MTTCNQIMIDVNGNTRSHLQWQISPRTATFTRPGKRAEQGADVYEPPRADQEYRVTHPVYDAVGGVRENPAPMDVFAYRRTPSRLSGNLAPFSRMLATDCYWKYMPSTPSCTRDKPY